MAIDRTAYNALVNDDGSNTVGTVWSKTSIKDVLLDPIDTAIAIGALATGRVPYGANSSNLTTRGVFNYDPATDTLNVPKVVASGTLRVGSASSIVPNTVEINHGSGSGGISFIFGPNPGTNAYEGYIAGFAYSSTGAGVKIGAQAYRWTDPNNSGGYASWNIHTAYMSAGGVQFDSLDLAVHGAHGAVFFPGDLTTDIPGLQVLRVRGTLETVLPWNGGTVARVVNTSTAAAAYATFHLESEGSEDVVLRQYSSGYSTSGANIASGALLLARRAGGLSLSVSSSDSNAGIRFWIQGSLAGRMFPSSGFVWGTPTGGDKGAGTINAQAVYDDNVLLTDWIFDLAYDGRTDVPHAGRLYPLAETQAITRAARRLAWMPSRETWETERNLGRMVTGLWQGQEQQQLYIHELEARIAALEARA